MRDGDLMRRVAVTGLGAVTPIGNNVADMWRSVKKEGVCGIAPITHYDTTGRKVTLAAEVKEFHPEETIDKKELRRMDRFTQFAAVAAKEAIEDAGLLMEQEDPKRCGVVVSSGIGGIDLIQEFTITGEKKGYDRISPLFIPMSISRLLPDSLRSLTASVECAVVRSLPVRAGQTRSGMPSTTSGMAMRRSCCAEVPRRVSHRLAWEALRL